VRGEPAGLAKNAACSCAQMLRERPERGYFFTPRPPEPAPSPEIRHTSFALLTVKETVRCFDAWSLYFEIASSIVSDGTCSDSRARLTTSSPALMPFTHVQLQLLPR